MRAAPAFQIEVERFGVWRAALGLLILLSVCATIAWQWFGRDSVDSPAVLRHALAFASLIAIAAAASRLWPRAFRLRWDGECWHVGPLPSSSPAAQAEAWAGQLGVAIDLGGWMLLRFAPTSGPRRCPYRWLAVQRGGKKGGLSAQWPALRVAVYSARSNQPPDSTNRLPARPEHTE